jgi:hypothetical protein
MRTHDRDALSRPYGTGFSDEWLSATFTTLDCALVQIFLVRFGRYNDPDGHPFVAKLETVTPRARRRGLGKMRLRHRNLRFRLDVEVAKDEGFEEARRTYGAKKG